MDIGANAILYNKSKSLKLLNVFYIMFLSASEAEKILVNVVKVVLLFSNIAQVLECVYSTCLGSKWVKSQEKNPQHSTNHP